VEAEKATAPAAVRLFVYAQLVGIHRNKPRKAIITPGNRHDSPLLPELIAGQRAEFVLGDASYDSKTDRKACKDTGAISC